MASKKAVDFHDDIKSLIGLGKTNPEIAEELGLSRAQVSCYVQKKLGGNNNYLKKKTKHKHLHKKILELRLKKTDKEIRKLLKLSKSEMKSCMSLAYRDPSLKHLRKETRRRDAWTTEELRFLLKWSGIIPRKEINKYLKRGKSDNVIKEKLQKLGLCSKNVNGMTFSQFRNMFKNDPEYYIATTAGSPASTFAKYANWKIVPWCHINEMLKSKKIYHSEAIEIYIEAMAMFQRWIHGEDYWASLTSEPRFC